MIFLKEHIQFLDDNKQMYTDYKLAGVIKHLSHWKKEKFQEIAKAIDSSFVATLHCGECVMDMVSFVYKNYEKEMPFILTEDDTEIQNKIDKPILITNERKKRRSKTS